MKTDKSFFTYRKISLSLHKKILLSHLCLFILTCGLISIIFIERAKVRESERILKSTNTVRKSIDGVYFAIIRLCTKGESVISWNNSDFNIYHQYRLSVDSLLQEMKVRCSGFVLPNQIDSLCDLLYKKEMNLGYIMNALKSREESDSIFSNKLPVIAKETLRMKTISQKKKGIAGLFGKKEIVQIPYHTNELRAFNDKLIHEINKQNVQVETYTDSLRLQNKLLNNKLYDFFSFLDGQIQETFIKRNLSLSEVRKSSFYQLFAVVSIAVVTLIIFFFIIRSDLRNEDKIKLKLRQVISENENLLEMRKKIILTVSHDIRGPLGNIHNCADLISETREKKKREIYLDDIRHSCQHVLHLVNDLMDAYRINEAGDLHNDIPFYLSRFLKRVSDEFSRKATSKGLILYSEHNGSNVTVKGDADKLEQVLANLLTNAIKFTSRGNVNFHSEYSEGKLRIEIRDTGIGMDEETLKRIFAPFERAAQNVNSEGFGLGLFLTKGLIKP